MNLFKKRKMSKISLFLFSICFLSLSLYVNVNADSTSYTTYHLHSTTSTTATTTDYNASLNAPTMSNVMGGCYTEAVQHWHNSSCPQSRCGGWVDRDGADPYKDNYYWGWCTVCGEAYGGNTQASFQCSKVTYNCGYSQGQFFGYRASGCGKSNA